MTELGALLAEVVKGTTQSPDKKDPSKNSKAKYNVDAGVKERVINRVRNLLDRFPVYPELDLEMLKSSFV
jgi:glycine hydroxymethyltransferase